MTVTEPRAAAAPAPPSGPAPGRGWFWWLSATVVGVAIVAGVVLRFVTRSHLWLDEALSVDIAHLPLRKIPDALRHDGHPPLYYFALHAWMQAFGTSAVAVRALSGVLGVATLPLAWLCGRRLGGRGAAWAAVLVLAVSPYALRYSTEARMYSLVMVLVLAGWLAVDSALRKPTALRLVAIAVLSGLLLLTHYWAMWFLAAVLGLLVVAAWRSTERARRRSARAVAIAVAAGGVLFAPWLGVLLYQSAHTGTPWATAARPTAIVFETLTDFGGGRFSEGYLLGFVLLLLFVLGLFGRAVDDRRIELDLSTVPQVRVEALLVGCTFVIAFLAEYATDTTYASRYAAIVFPFVALVAGVGLTRFRGKVALVVVVSVLLALAAAGAVYNVRTDRTQAGVIAAGIRAGAGPDDVVVMCPDQLGPATHRLLPATLRQVTYPRFGDPAFVDWVDYAARNAKADPAAFARRVLASTPPTASVWLVWSGSYRTLEGQCEALYNALAQARPAVTGVVGEDPDAYFEHAGLARFGPQP